MNQYKKDYGKVGLTFEHYLQGRAVEELTLVAYEGELYVSLRGTVMNENIPVATDDWYKVSTFGDLLAAIEQVKADAETVKAQIDAIKAEADAVLDGMRSQIDREIASIESRVSTLIAQLTAKGEEIDNAEFARKAAESLRKDAETLRINAEELRAAAEIIRANAESDRNTAERERVSTDNARKEDWAHLRADITATVATATSAAERAVQAAQQAEPVIARAQAAAEAAEREAAKIQPVIEQMQTTFETNEGSRQQTFNTNETQREQRANETIQELEQAGGSSAVVDMSRDFGKYVQRPDVTLEVVQTGKRFTKDGEMVADANWNIGRIGSVERGLLYELLMGGSAKMVLGTALFVSHTVEKRGTQDVDIYTPVFSALGTALPVSNYAVLWAGENYSDLLVSYRNDVAGANVMRVAEWGLFKSIATQYANLKAQVNLKSFADGYYAGMRVGTADNLTPRGEASEETFMERVAGGSHAIEDGDANIRSIKGKTLKVVQLANLADFTLSAGVTADKTFCGLGVNTKIGHKYLCLLTQNGQIASSERNTLRFAFKKLESSSTNFHPNAGVHSLFYEANADEYAAFVYWGQGTSADCSFSKAQVFDLTAMFGAGNEPTTTQAFAEALGYPSIDAVPYFAYTEGKLVPSKVEGVRTTGRNLISPNIADEILGAIGWVKLADGKYKGDIAMLHVFSRKGIFKDAIVNNPLGMTLSAEYELSSLSPIFVGFVHKDGTTQLTRSSELKGRIVCQSNVSKEIEGVMFSYSENIPVTLSNIQLEIGRTATDYEPYEAHERKWGETLRKYFPDGLNAEKSAYDEFTPTKATKRTNMVNMNELNWKRGQFGSIYAFYAPAPGMTYARAISSKYNEAPVAVPSLNNKEFTTSAASGYVYVRDDEYTTPAALIAALQGEKLVYRLAEPEEYTYDELNLTERVFAGGMESAIVPEGEESAPLVADIVYPIDAYNTIKSNKAKIEDLQQKPAISLTADEVTKLRALISAATQSEGGEL